jgi:hypothetical protein
MAPSCRAARGGALERCVSLWECGAKRRFGCQGREPRKPAPLAGTASRPRAAIEAGAWNQAFAGANPAWHSTGAHAAGTRRLVLDHATAGIIFVGPRPGKGPARPK